MENSKGRGAALKAESNNTDGGSVLKIEVEVGYCISDLWKMD